MSALHVHKFLPLCITAIAFGLVMSSVVDAAEPSDSPPLEAHLHAQLQLSACTTDAKGHTECSIPSSAPQDLTFRFNTCYDVGPIHSCAGTNSIQGQVGSRGFTGTVSLLRVEYQGTTTYSAVVTMNDDQTSQEEESKVQLVLGSTPDLSTSVILSGRPISDKQADGTQIDYMSAIVVTK